MNLLDHPPATWGEILADKGQAAYRGRQMAHWVYQRFITDPLKMSNIPAGIRDLVATGTLSLDHPELLSSAHSFDGTVKMAFRLLDGPVIESVLIPRKGQWTLCLSTQAGCGIGCRFCRTASMGLTRNLTTSEILPNGFWPRVWWRLSPLTNQGSTILSSWGWGSPWPISRLSFRPFVP